MNKAIVKNWNEVVDWDDDVYVLGDLVLNNDEEGRALINQLKGRIHICYGNHDTDNRIEQVYNTYNIVEQAMAMRMRVNGLNFYLSHYPTLCGNFDGDKPLKSRTINLCGHTHTQDRFFDWDKGLIYHVELETHDCRPVSLEEIINDIKKKWEEMK